MVEINSWLDAFMNALDDTFGYRIWFVGLQGSYGREEATENSDIDVVVILDELSALDIERYRTMLDQLQHRELICGFLSGKAELLNWDPADLFQFYYDTRPIRGSLYDMLPLIDAAAVDRAIKIGACNIYHSCVHNMLHEKSDEVLRGLYKSASFLVQAIIYRQTGNYIKHQKQLLRLAMPNERKIIRIFCRLRNGEQVDFENMSEALFDWARSLIGKGE